MHEFCSPFEPKAHLPKTKKTQASAHLRTHPHTKICTKTAMGEGGSYTTIDLGPAAVTVPSMTQPASLSLSLSLFSRAPCVCVCVCASHTHTHTHTHRPPWVGADCPLPRLRLQAHALSPSPDKV